MDVVQALLFVLVAVGFSKGSSEDGYKRVCYYQKSSRVPVSAVPADLCTHIIFAFAVIKDFNIVPESSKDLDLYQQLIQKKKESPGLKVMVSLQVGFPAVANGTTNQMITFSKNTVAFLRKNNLDGVDFDWESPKPNEKDSYSKLLKVFRSVLEEEVLEEDGTPLLLSLALMPSSTMARKIYDVPIISSVVDFATAMTYDYHLFIKNVSEVTAYNSPLFTAVDESPMYSANATISFYLSAGMAKGKLLLGMSTYGRSYTLVSAGKHSLHAPASGIGKPGPVYGIKGFYSYQDSCVKLKSASRVWDSRSEVPYLYKDVDWVSYDDLKSVSAKCNWLKSKGLGGIGVWSTAWDDYNNMCGQGVFPLISAAKKGLRSNTSHGDVNISARTELK